MIDHCVVVVSRYLSLAILFCLDMRYPFTCITWFAVFVSFKKYRGGVAFFFHCSHLYLSDSGCECTSFAAFFG